MGPLRYLLFAAAGVVVASVLFVALNFIVSANFEAGTSFIERWIVRATCSQYELAGIVRDSKGQPVPFAIIEVAYFQDRLSTRSANDGRFVVKAAEPVCDQAPPANVAVLVLAEDFRPKRQSVAFATTTLEVTLDAKDFRP